MKRGRALGAAALLAAAVALAGCGGGGSSPATRPSVTPSASASASANPNGSTVFDVTSVPAGLNLSYSNGLTTLPATTPVVLAPGASNVAFAISIVPTNGRPVYDFVGDQRNDGPRTVLYNQAADTTGSIARVAAASTGRGAASTQASRSAASRAAAREPRVAPRATANRPNRSDTRVVVRYRVAALRARRELPRDLEANVGATDGRDVGFERAGLVTRAFGVPAGRAAAVAAQLRADPAVESAQPDVLDYADGAAAVTPNDTHFDDYTQWYLFQIGAPNGWGYTEGTPAVAIAVVDTGADFAHPDLAGKIAYAESVLAGVVTPGNAAAQDTNGHGTNVAGIAAADTNNAYGFAGTGFDVGLQVYKVFSDGTAANGYATSANASDVAIAIYDAVAHGARVLNLSLGQCAALGFNAAQQDAVDYALAHDVVVVAASGNDRSSSKSDTSCQGASSTLDFPAAFDGVTSVGASAIDDSANPRVRAGAPEHVASYSNAGPGISLVAPGGDPSAEEIAGTQTPDLLHWIEGLYTTTPANPQAACHDPSDCRALFVGTSQATPQVAAAAALVASLAPGWSAARIRATLLATADDIGDPLQGAGRLNVYRALAAAAGDPNPPAPPAPHNFTAFAYAGGGTTPHVLDVTYPTGVAVASDGTFRIADVPANAPPYRVAVWYDANGDGVVDAGDYFAASGICGPSAPCASASGLVPTLVPSGFTPP